ncbi:MAG TPA: [FeFe] hydrogenase H-cluster radical SAM maturase HydG, partial [Deltaproteobacteria bacterium]|nr:[FeFe] hydrogenase H-cluster radical SAM maturase HydG [Deltaproteobacteria bacterium]
MIIDARRVENILSNTRQPTASMVDNILARASMLNCLCLEDSAVLLSVGDSIVLQKIFQRAGEVKEKVFGKRIVLFAPLYLSNYCTNNCLYCGFRKDNKDAV